jgi:hypothetical protein
MPRHVTPRHATPRHAAARRKRYKATYEGSLVMRAEEPQVVRINI